MAYIERNRIKTGEFWGQTPRKKWGQTPIFLIEVKTEWENGVRPRYSY